MNHLKSWLPSRGNVLFMLVIAASLIFYVHSVGAFPSISQPTAPQATSTGTIAYQGRLFSTSGTPLNSSYPMTFTFYNVPTGGLALWAEARPGVIVSDGLFNVLLGSVTPITPSIITGNNNLWLGVQVGVDQEMTPRVQLGSAPYAMQGWTVPDGAIGSAQIADGSVASQDVKLTMGRVVMDIPGPVIAITLTSIPQDVPGTTILLNPPTPQSYLFFTVADLEVNNTCVVANLYVDDVVQSSGLLQSSNSVGTNRGTIAQTYLVNLAPGSHTVVLKASECVGSEGTIYEKHTSITYIAVSQ